MLVERERRLAITMVSLLLVVSLRLVGQEPAPQAGRSYPALSFSIDSKGEVFFSEHCRVRRIDSHPVDIILWRVRDIRPLSRRATISRISGA